MLSTCSDATMRAGTEANEALAGLLGTVREIRGSDDLIGELIKEFSDLRGKLPIDLMGAEAAEPLDPTSPATLRIIVAQARELLLARLTSDAR
jgi:hypothetical protein